MRQRYLGPLNAGQYGPFHVWWLCWFLFTIGSFVVVETYGLIKGGGPTLSEAIWYVERFKKGQPIEQWSALHILILIFLVLLLMVVLWLIGHFTFGIWR